MPTVGLGTFLKLCEMDASHKAKALEKYLTPGGYDFYWRLKSQAIAHTAKQKPYSECEQLINTIKDEVERKHNLLGMQALGRWVAKEKENGTTFFMPPTGQRKSPKGHFIIKLEPEIGAENSGIRRYISLWNSKTPEMTTSLARIGSYLLHAHLKENLFTEFYGAILDLRAEKLFVSESYPAGMEFLITDELTRIDNFFEGKLPPSAPGPHVPAPPL